MRPIIYNPDDNKFDVPPGKYLARFVECKEKEPFDGPSKYGKSGEPRYGWRFEVCGPPGTDQAGKILEQNTGTVPSRRSGLVRLLNMMIAGGLQPMQAVNPPDFVGRLYQIKWDVNPDSDKGNCYIKDLEEVGASATTTPPARVITNPHAPPVPARQGQLVTPTLAGPVVQPLVPPGTLPVPKAPPPRNKQLAPRPAPTPAEQQRYYVIHPTLNGGEKPALMTGQEVQAFLDVHHTPPDRLEVCAEGADEWKTAAAFGFKDSVPY